MNSNLCEEAEDVNSSLKSKGIFFTKEAPEQARAMSRNSSSPGGPDEIFVHFSIRPNKRDLVDPKKAA